MMIRYCHFLVGLIGVPIVNRLDAFLLCSNAKGGYFHHRQPILKSLFANNNNNPYTNVNEGNNDRDGDDSSSMDLMRRGLFSSILCMATGANSLSSANALSSFPTTTAAFLNVDPEMVTVPLQYTGNELLIYYRVDGSLFRAVLDTGSPFLMIPGACGDNTKAKSGCYQKQGIPSGLETTYEQFDGFAGDVEWRMAPVSLVNATGVLRGPPLVTFGVASESIMAGPGGVFFGMIRDTDDWIRPSFLGQTLVQCFQLDLLSIPHTLTLSTAPILPLQTTKHQDYIPLTSDLRKKFGDPVNHYTAKAKSIKVNSFPLVVLDGNDGDSSRRPIYIIFDTGVTGMLMSRELFNERYAAARQRREHNLWGNVEISFSTQLGKTVTMSAEKPLTFPFDPQNNWKKFHGHLIVMGLSFLNGNRITIDIDRERLWIEN